MDKPPTLKSVLTHLEERIVDADVVRYVERLAAALDAASNEIVRQRKVIDDHVHNASRLVVTNYEVEPITQLDINGMTTVVHTRPILWDFYLAEPLGGWSEDHRRAFHNAVVRGFSEQNADAIAKSIWSVPTQQQ